FCERERGLTRSAGSDITLFDHELLSVEEARRIGTFAAQAPVQGDKKAIIIAAGRLFHEAQNSFLKLFEEPPQGTTLILVVPAYGMLVPTLRSRLMRLEGEVAVEAGVSVLVNEFLNASKTEREKIVTRIVNAAKSEKDTDKQRARLEAIALVHGLTTFFYEAQKNLQGKEKEDIQILLQELDTFMPILHERSPALKLIFEHLLLVLPEKVGK
ncbi:hypothetical protein KKG57_00805, partial [Patescibacteria group bacterium]|nr:hypothetical protein [Patescibacteria group bacterium]